MTRKRFLHPERPVEVLHIVMKTTGKVDKNDAWTLNDERRKKLINEFRRFNQLYLGVSVVGMACLNNHLHALVKLDHTYKRSRKDMAAAYFECYGKRIHPNSSECYQLLKDQSNISKFIGRLARDFSYHFNVEIEIPRGGHLWQKRFHSTQIEDTIGLLRCWIYIIMNPVKAGMTASATADRFTSLTFEDQAWCEEVMINFHQLWQEFEEGNQTKNLEEFKAMVTGLLEEAVTEFLALSEVKRSEWREQHKFWKKASAVGSPESLAKCSSLPGPLHKAGVGELMYCC